MADVASSLVFVFCALFFWGSWPVTLKISGASAEFYFIGYSLGCATASLCVLAYLIKEDFALFDNSFFPFSLVAGFIANTGKFANIVALEHLGITVAHSLVLGIDVGVGTILLYLMDSSVNAYFLFSGVLFVLAGVLFDILSELQAHQFREIDEVKVKMPPPVRERRARTKSPEDDVEQSLISVDSDSTKHVNRPLSLRDRSSRHAVATLGPRASEKPELKGLLSDTSAPTPFKKRPSVAESNDRRFSQAFTKMGLLSYPATEHRTPSNDPNSSDPNSHEISMTKDHELPPSEGHQTNSVSYKGIFLAVYAGCALGGWPLIFEHGTSHDLIHWQEFFFGWTIGLCLSTTITLPVFIRFGDPDYSTLNFRTVILGWCGGLLMSFGIWLTFMSHDELTFVVSMTIVRCAPLVSAFWGIFVFWELAGAGFRAQFFMGLSLLFYITAVCLITCSIIFAEDQEEDAEELLAQEGRRMLEYLGFHL